MPRISTPTILQAYRQNPLLALLLKECRHLEAARNEMRWLREFVDSSSERKSHRDSGKKGKSESSRLQELCKERARGVPLQYILGTQPFGELEILCRRHVLIPRLLRSS